LLDSLLQENLKGRMTSSLRRTYPLPSEFSLATPDLVFHCNDGVYEGSIPGLQ